MAPVVIDLRSAGITAPLLELNNRHARELSFLEPERFRQLVDTAFFACRIGEAEALLLAFDQTAAYDSPNFLWFRARYDQFVYVDRIVVDPRARGRGLARTLYENLFERSLEAGHVRVVCEINLYPPNPASDSFHKQLGFERVGEAQLASDKRVRYYSRPLH